ncbi:hypothetical protein RJT34_29077 [Clitoria ternatea]|uniref:Uncharacterized protein n=1 Tax=Clitoria ternatea TaxID=43366 RepID=A0AAN9IAQ3_CLITE
MSMANGVCDDIRRPCVEFAPSIWGDTFLPFASNSSTEVNDNVKQQAEILKEDVKKMFQPPINQNIKQTLNFIDSIQRLGVSYHFQSEINQTLEQIYNNFTINNAIINEDNLDHHFLALLFRLLRQAGHHISSDVFKILKNEQGNFKEIPEKDVQGLCSLYEAANLRSQGDDILEEAYDLAYTRLNSLANNPSLAAQINYCLRRPHNKSISRSEARYHMTLHQQDPSHNQILLTFAKLDFNILQKLHQREIGIITKWWKNSDFVKKVPYARDRLVESYVWPLAMSCEPEHSIGRMFLGRVVGVIALLDDTYDAYGTVQELELFTEAIQRWDIRIVASLPQCMKVVFDAIVELCGDMELVTTHSGKSSFVVPHFKRAVCELLKAYMVEAQWCHEGYTPTYDEYKSNGVVTSTLPLFTTTLTCMVEFATEDVLNWISNYPIIIKAASVIGRFLDDMASHKFEQQRVHVASAVECCMKQYNISEEEAYIYIHKDVEDCWKVINEEYLKLNDLPKSLVDWIVNLARMCEVSYENYKDRFTNGELLKDYISSLLLDPI